MQRVTYNECLHNHAANLGRYMVDGCHEYSPKYPSTDLLCAACGCHRNFHRKVTVFDPDVTEASGNYNPADKAIEAVPLMIEAGGEDENLNPVVEPPQQERKKRPKSKFTKEQVESLRAFAESLGWSTRDRSRAPDIEEFCAELGINKIVFTTWLYNNKKHYGCGSSSKKNGSSAKDKN